MKLLNTKILLTLVAAALIGGAMLYNQVMGQQQMQRPPQKKIQPVTEVAYQAVTVADYQASVSGVGEITAVTSLNLLSEVAGTIKWISPLFQSGNIIKKGQKILTIDDGDYQLALASAQSALRDAELALLQEQRNSEQAAIEWRESGLTQQPASDLLLRKPQLAAAQSKLVYAQQQLKQAEDNLRKTQLIAPFDLLVVEKNVALASYLQPTAQVGLFYATDQFEVAIPLTEQQWQLLDQTSASRSENNSKKTAQAFARLSDLASGKSCDAEYARELKHIDQQSRQRSLVLSIRQPLAQSQPLFPGSYVKADMQGKNYQSIWKVPASSLTQDGMIWYVSKDNLLKKFQAEVLFAKDQSLFIRPFNHMASANIVIRPLASYLPDMKVTGQPRGQG